jgi:hypothetical protein
LKAVTKKATAKKATTKKPALKVVKSSAPAKKAVPAKKPAASKASAAAGLTLVAKSGLDAVIKKGSPFKVVDVIDFIMKQNAKLNRSSVTTAVNKMIGQVTIKSELVKNPVGRSYRLFKP